MEIKVERSISVKKEEKVKMEVKEILPPIENNGSSRVYDRASNRRLDVTPFVTKGACNFSLHIGKWELDCQFLYEKNEDELELAIEPMAKVRIFKVNAKGIGSIKCFRVNGNFTFVPEYEIGKNMKVKDTGLNLILDDAQMQDLPNVFSSIAPSIMKTIEDKNKELIKKATIKKATMKNIEEAENAFDIGSDDISY